MHSADQSSSDITTHVKPLINVFRNQIILRQAVSFECSEEPHKDYKKIVTLPAINYDYLINALKNCISSLFTRFLYQSFLWVSNQNNTLFY